MRNIGWYGLADGSSRLTRLITTVILARYISAYELGIAATAITIFELVRIVTNNGLAQFVARTPEDRLAATCNTAHQLGWAFCLGAAALLSAAGIAIAWSGGRAELFAMTACLAGVFLVMPAGLVRVYLLMRSNNVRQAAQVSTLQAVTDNVLTAVLAAAGAGAWSIVLPKLLTAPIWLIGVRWGGTWTFDATKGFIPRVEILKYSTTILGSEILNAIRFNGDKIFVGLILGVEALGIYYFIFNAGIGFSLSLTTALSNSVFPELVQYARNQALLLKRFERVLLRTVAPVSAIIAVQAVASFAYVPVVFGDKWAEQAPLVAMLCFSAISKPYYDASTQLLRAAGLGAREFFSSAILTACCVGAMAIFLADGLQAGVAAMAATAFATQLILAAWARHTVQTQGADNLARGSQTAIKIRGLALA